ncbi:MAG TPA: hypothetical protein DD658_10540, partial [Deltaproteobacteria bacterium]|nr:hypothetical protein [Deltaproteobacteria bacterium]
MKETGERGSAACRISCSPWQSVQPGASGTPREKATPCTLSRKMVNTPKWHFPQVVGMLGRKIGEAGSKRSLRSCPPWQST